MKPLVAKFSRLIVTVPRVIAEPYGVALVEVGAGAVEERPADNPNAVEIVVTLPDEESAGDWLSLVRTMYQAFAEQLKLPIEGLWVRREDCELDYHGAWLKHLTRQQLTDTIVFLPTSDSGEIPVETRAMRFEPHPSFGDGSHSTTRLAASAIEHYCRSRPGCSVLDVGTGNGVLSFVAALSGASKTLGIDLDEQAVSAARDNACRNQLEQCCVFQAGSLESAAGQFDLVVANLPPRVQVELLESMVTRVGAGGQVLLTGFLVEQADIITQPLAALGFVRRSSCDADGYALDAWQADDGRSASRGRS